MSENVPVNADAMITPPMKTGGRGHDISSKRQDELDFQSVKTIEDRTAAGLATIALDLGGGYGAQAQRFAEAGAIVTLIDRGDMARETFNRAVTEGRVKPDALNFVQKDFTSLTAADVPDNIDVFYSQRAIHYVPYDEAAKTLSLIFNKMAPGSKAFVSAAGYDTEYGLTYPDRDKPVEQRYSLLTPDMAEKHDIRTKIVTYAEADLAKLLINTGFTDVQVARSDFGNIKAMARKP